MKKFDCIGFDHPDYWSGYHLPCLQIAVYDAMTNLEIVEQLRSELNLYFDMFENWSKEDDDLFNEYCKKLLETPDKIGIDPRYENNPEEWDDCVEPMNLYFSFVNPVTFGGLTFMNP